MMTERKRGVNVFIPLNFAGLSDKLSSLKRSKVVVIPVPYEATTSFVSGTRRGPLAIIEASTHMELFDDEIKKEIASIGIHTLDQLEPVTSNPESMIERVEEVVSRVISSNKFPVVLGGEHSITLGIVKALKNRYSEIGVVQFDAHADLRDTYQGSKFSHACVGRRICETSQLTQVGVRSLCKEEFDFLKHSKTYSYFARDILEHKGRIEDLIENLPADIYITIDLDVLDPSIMPSVGTPEPGGFVWYEMIHLLKLLTERKNIVGFDIVELCPQPVNPGPDFLAAKLCYKLLGYIYFKKMVKII
jgi:agmatinase